jgi:hypothetical protein
MLSSQRTLARVQLSRDVPAKVLTSRAPVTEAALEAFRQRNAILDAFFYDIGVVRDSEAQIISPWLAREGSLLIVPPSGTGEIQLFETIDGFASGGGRDVRALTVAGVGSSALGSAAFARNVADALDEPVAAVVSGYGLADFMTEAAGGWFFFRTLNGLRHAFEGLEPAGDMATREAGAATTQSAASLVRFGSRDTQVATQLLTDNRFRFSLLSGHSKGNLVIAEALAEAVSGRRGALSISPDTAIVTVSAAIYMPKAFTNIIDVIGQLDWFGAINSRPDISIELRRPLAWHHTNTELPMHLPVTATFRQLIAQGQIIR